LAYADFVGVGNIRTGVDMHFNRKLASDLLEIKRNLPEKTQDQLSLSVSDIEEAIFDINQSTSNQKLKDLTKSFLDDANSKWAKKVDRESLNPFFLMLRSGSAMIGRCVNTLTGSGTTTKHL
jgi:hypothetical protein